MQAIQAWSVLNRHLKLAPKVQFSYESFLLKTLFKIGRNIRGKRDSHYDLTDGNMQVAKSKSALLFTACPCFSGKKAKDFDNFLPAFASLKNKNNKKKTPIKHYLKCNRKMK